MPSRNNFEVIGLEELAIALSNQESEIRAAAKIAMDKAGDLLLSATRKKLGAVTRRDTGKLSRSLRIKRDNSGSKNAVLSNALTWGDDVRDYAAPLELGHDLTAWGRETGIPIEPRPFLRPAADENKDEIFDIIEKHVDEALKKFGDNK